METRKTLTETIWFASAVWTFAAGKVQFDVATQDCAQGGNVWMENLQYAEGGTYEELNTSLTEFLSWLSLSLGPLTVDGFFQVSEKLSSQFPMKNLRCPQNTESSNAILFCCKVLQRAKRPKQKVIALSMTLCGATVALR